MKRANVYITKSFVALMLFSNPPPNSSPSFFVASPQEYKTSFLADGKLSHLPHAHTHTVMDASMCPYAHTSTITYLRNI